LGIAVANPYQDRTGCVLGIESVELAIEPTIKTTDLHDVVSFAADRPVTGTLLKWAPGLSY